MNDERRLRAKKIHQGLTVQEIDKQGIFFARNEAERQRMFWFLNTEQLKQLEADYALLETPSEERVKAKRFDFQFNNSYYVLNAKVTYNDCGMAGRSRYSHGRVIS